MHGIYIHIPFCAQKCSYCDFLSFPGAHTAAKARYQRALEAELRLRVRGRWQKPETIFIGGGTPTTLSAGELASLMAAIDDCVDLSAVEEFTVEANPGTVDAEKLAILRAGGVNRISFGVQSFDDDLLRMLGRLHTAREAEEAVAFARAAGFENINLDLMYGLPGQTAAQWRATVDRALALHPEHLSLYQLIPEPGTAIVRRMAEGQLPAVDEDGAADWFDAQRGWLAAAGYEQYEISNYAQPGRASLHNQLYWHLDDYLGLGLGATGWTRPTRATNTDDFAAYCAALENGARPDQTTETLDRAAQMSESVFMALRMNAGLDRARFRTLYGQDVAEIFPAAIDEGIARGWLNLDDDRLALTDAGRRLGNWVFELFL
ncbi:MAG: radical SAM family heme chaperone HemW [Peptococcaceae bacterium]|nr:radical SAM family heme chaperone HemW [Peptococcaceae bacterium]